MSEIYTKAFYDENARVSVVSYFEIARAIEKCYGKPIGSIIDLGCSLGGMLRTINATKKLGVDFHDYPMDVPYFKFDLRNLDKSHFGFGIWDVAVCLETSEHLPPETGPHLVRQLCELSDFVVFSGATPGQGGTDHINEKPKEYWEGLFKEQGYDCFDWIRPLLKDSQPWYKNNVYLYKRTGEVPEIIVDVK